MELLFALIGGLTSYFNYRHDMANGNLPKTRLIDNSSLEEYVPKPLGPNATRLEKIAHWLGIEDE